MGDHHALNKCCKPLPGYVVSIGLGSNLHQQPAMTSVANSNKVHDPQGIEATLIQQQRTDRTGCARTHVNALVDENVCILDLKLS